jgi:hypothetical protein
MRIPGIDLKVAGFSKSALPFDMFDIAREAEEARRANKLRNIYHKGQDLAWDGREVLEGLVEKHGGIHLAPDKQDALRRIFAIILWGELAAWKISAQLADRLVPLEAKMAATAQVHDEARHFYVMYDYLSLLGDVPTEVERPTRAVLDLVLNTDSMLEKLIGMQLMVETLALTIFQLVREADVEPVLSELLPFFEKDEARHVGLGVQHLPELMRAATKRETAQAIVFQLKIVGWVLRGLKLLEPDLEKIGVSARRVIKVGRNKMFTATEMLWQGMGVKRPPARDKVDVAIDSLCELLFPEGAEQAGWGKRWTAARHVWKSGGLAKEIVKLAPS